MQQIRQLVVSEFQSVDQLIIQQLASDVSLVENIGHYLIEAGGKRLRPLITLLASRALGPANNHAIAFAAAVEFIHSATLLHDDVVDVSLLRRGLPTANARFGNAPSVLVGDFIYSRAFQLLVGIGNLDLMGLMANTTNIIAEGEVLQLTKAGDPNTTEADYMEVIRRKTAVLFAAATEGAALISGGSQIQREALRCYGENLGIVFQLVDDILDYQGDSSKTGKNVGDDLAEGKPTLPLIYTLTHGNVDEKNLVTHAIREKSSANLNSIIAIIQGNGALDYIAERVDALTERAIRALDPLPESPFREGLTRLALLAAKRDR